MKRIWKIFFSKENITRWRRRLQGHLNRPIYIPLVAGIAALNSFLPFFPVELFLILRVLIRPRQWWRNATIAALASGIGMVCLAHLVQYQPHGLLTHWLEHLLGQTKWEEVSQFVNRRGALGLFLVSVSFLPLPPAVVVCALSGVSDWEIAGSISLGHCFKYGFFSWLATRSPFLFEDSNQDVVSG